MPALRGALAIDPASALKLDGTFALHPSLAKLRKLYAGGAGDVLPRGRVSLPRPLALRRPERAGNRRQGALPAEGRLDEPAARPAAAQRQGGHRIYASRAAGAARRGRGHDLCTVCAARRPTRTC